MDILGMKIQRLIATTLLALSAGTAGAAPLMFPGDEIPSLATASLLESTYLIDLHQGSFLSDKTSRLRSGGYELADGRYQSFNKWYRTKWKDVSAAWMTQVTPDFGVIYGFSSGERGEKYTIQPSLKVGFVAHKQISEHAHFTLRATTVVGGRLREKSCVADYGDIGGVQAVNCRLAATLLPPAETLGYLMDEEPDRHQVFMTFVWTY